MPLDNFLNPASEDTEIQEQFTDEEIIEMVQNVDEDPEQEEAEVDLPSPFANMTNQEKIVTLAKAIAIAEEELEGHEEDFQVLRKVQRNLRWKEQQRKCSGNQTSITNFLQRN